MQKKNNTEWINDSMIQSFASILSESNLWTNRLNKWLNDPLVKTVLASK